MRNVTQILNAIDGGDGQVIDQLLPAVYEDLRHLAAQKLSRERPGQTLQATALVHEAYLRLVGIESQNWSSRAHFFNAAAEAMRRILIENARRKRRLKRGGNQQRLDVMDTKQVIARFEAERQALAMMDHPNIAKVLDAGTTESGRPYFVMELVRGISITEFCDKNDLSTWERLDLFVSVCQAVQHAHQKGIIHRDIKPSNVMVTLYDGKPVSDFLTDDLLASVHPERAKGQEVTVRYILKAASENLEAKFHKSPLAEVKLRQAIGLTHQKLGDYPGAEPHLRRALEIRRQQLGEGNPLTLASLHYLGTLHTNQGRYKDAEPLLVRAVEMRKELLGDEHPDTLASMCNLAWLYL